MRIKIIGFRASVISTEYKYKKSKKNKRTYRRKVPLKRPYLSVSHDIEVYGECVLGATYVDDNNNMWVCVRKHNFTEPIGEMRMAQLKKYKTYTLPTSVSVLSTSAGEN